MTVSLVLSTAACIDVPPDEPGLTAPFRQVDVAYGHACGVTDAGTAYCWGGNINGQLGNGSFELSPEPVPVAGDHVFAEIAVDGDRSCARTPEGTVFCWGAVIHDDPNAPYGGLDYVQTPEQVPGLDDATLLAVSNDVGCVIRLGGTVACWGWSVYGSLGDGGPRDQWRRVEVPVEVVGITDAVDLELSGLTACAVKASGEVACWGSRAPDLAGDPTHDGDGASTPVTLPGLTDIAEIAIAQESACVRTAAGRVSCWGDNYWGEVGDGTRQARATPVAVPGLSNATALSASARAFCALQATGRISCWGLNYRGQLGLDESIEMSPSPTEVPGMVDAVSTALGYGKLCAIGRNNALSCWGNMSWENLPYAK